MNQPGQPGTLIAGDIGSGIFNTPLSDTPLFGMLDDSRTEEASGLLPRRALNELELEYALACSSEHDEEAAPANQLSRIYARHFLTALNALDEPSDVYFNSHGDAVLEWHPGPGRVAVVTIGGNGDLRYASAKYGARSYGIQFWAGAIPEKVLGAIRWVRRR